MMIWEHRPVRSGLGSALNTLGLHIGMGFATVRPHEVHGVHDVGAR